MGKAKKRNLKREVNDKFKYMTRESALEFIVQNIDNKDEILDLITLFGFSAEEMLEAGAPYENVIALGGIVTIL